MFVCVYVQECTHILNCILTGFDMGHTVYQDQDELSDVVQSCRFHVQQMVVGIVVERVSVGVTCEMFVGRDPLC